MYFISNRLFALKVRDDLVLVRNNNNNKKCWIKKETWFKIVNHTGERLSNSLLNEVSNEELKKIIMIKGIYKKEDNDNTGLISMNMFNNTINNYHGKIEGSIILVGYDSGDNISLGARKGPETINKLSQAYETALKDDLNGIKGWIIPKLWGHDYEVLNGANLNSFYIGEDNKKSNKNFFEYLSENISNNEEVGSNYWIVGGDHSITLGGVKSLIKNGEDSITLIYFDAHLDAGDDKCEINNSNFISHILELQEVKNIYQIGRRGIYSLSNTQFLEHDKLHCINSIKDIPISEIKNTTIYCSIDLDFLDPSIAPGVSSPVPQGYTINFLEKQLSLLKEHGKIDYGDITEYHPNSDSKGFITGQILLRILLVGLGISLERIKKKEVE